MIAGLFLNYKSAIFEANWIMFKRFTERARRVIILAREEAELYRHEYLGTEHILQGVIKDGGGIAVAIVHFLDYCYCYCVSVLLLYCCCIMIQVLLLLLLLLEGIAIAIGLHDVKCEL